ncbi:response regulator transcription factor [uncultured Draconibacterium sp.]|uniref:response regulator transcription factor n=1 Tax=uncultured Draconibacterium sp. TaxID=1573823 RepID=UPI0025F061ED|nr:response regulator transcription factor [uncultured Draconibacterium sp.]
MDKIDIYIVDDHALFRQGLKLLLTNLSFVGDVFEANNGEEFISGLKNHPVEIALVDIEMPVMNGIEAAKRARELQPSIKVLALSMYSEKNYYLSMIDAGACGFLLKNSNFEEVEKAIAAVRNENSYISIEILNDILKYPDKCDFNTIDSDLTERETEVLLLICNGLTNQEIAEKLVLSKRTVDKHRENLLLKTQSKNTASLVIYAIKSGLLQI